MTSRRIALVALVAAAAVAAALFGGVLGDDGSKRSVQPPAAAATATPGAPEAQLERLLLELSSGDTDELARRLERRVERNGFDVESLTLLGLAYQQRFRETADPTYLTLSGTSLRRATRLQPQAPLATSGLALLAVAQHRWDDAVRLARRALARNAEDATALAALGDGLLALGRYDGAFDAYDRLAVLSPTASAYGRVAQGRELLGHPDGALRALELALRLDVTGVPEHEAWARVQLGNLHASMGRNAKAAAAYERALALVPGYPAAEAGLARAEAARGRYGSAVERLRRVVEVQPLPQHVVLLGDVLAASGRQSEADRAYGLVDAIERLLEANGVRTELQTALFDLDRGRDLGGALARARAAYAEAPSVNAADVLAWALYKNGRCEEALARSVEALRLQTRDALMLFHRGMIERCLGHESEARRFIRAALDVNPQFSLVYARVAREAVA